MFINDLQNDIDFFLSYQYPESEETVFGGLGFLSSLAKKNGEKDYSKSLNNIFFEEIKKIIETRKLEKIGVLLSGGVDSFLLLYYIRKAFPNIKIFTFTFFPDRGETDSLLKLEKLSTCFNTTHTNIYKEVLFEEIISILRLYYSKGMSLLGDEGMIYNAILLNALAPYYDGKYLISGDGIDVIFGGLSMYRLSYLERISQKGIQVDDSVFIDSYEKEYFYKNIKNYDADFFYKYGEYFGGNFLKEGGGKEIEYFFQIYNQIDGELSPLKKQIYFNYICLVENRKHFIYNIGELYGYEMITPFIENSFVKKVFELDIPDTYLLNEKETKIIIRALAERIKSENNIDFPFLPTYKIDFYNEYRKNIKKVGAIGNYLYRNSYITKEHYQLVPYFIKNAMWYENKIRIYLLLNLYFFIKSKK